MLEIIVDKPIDYRQLSLEVSTVSGAVLKEYAHPRIIIDCPQESEASASAVVTAHVAGSKDIKLYRYLSSSEDKMTPPFDVNYESGTSIRLHPKVSSMVRGEVRRIDYYANATMDANGVITYSDLVLRESFSYQRDALGFARSRTQTISWYREDGTAHPQTKVRQKLYDNDESIREGVRRRNNITDRLSMDITGILLQTQTQLTSMQDRIDLGRNFMRAYKLSFDMFIEASSNQILFDVRDDASPEFSWLNIEISTGVTVRSKIISDLNIWGIAV